MISNRKFVAGYLALAFLYPLSLFAGRLDGVITESSSGSGVEGARVAIPALDKIELTDRRGYFAFPDLPAGSYDVQVRYYGAATVEETVSIPATGTERLDVTINVGLVELEAITITQESFQTASLRAANLQRTSTNLRNVVASDYFGRFADTNAAEALNRLPGLSVERDQGEGRFVIIRGIDPSLNTVAIDGVQLAAPSDDSRSTLLDTIPIEVTDTLEVSKAVLPDQPGDAIGGYINLRTPSAFNHDERVAKISGAAIYTDLTDQWGYKVHGSYADRFGKDKNIGLYLTFIDSERSFGSDNVESEPWAREGGSFVPDSEFEYREYDLRRERTGVSANVEYRPSDTSLFFFRTSFNEYTDYEERDLSISAFEGDFTNVTGSRFTNDAVESVVELKQREETMQIWTASLGGEQTFGDWELGYSLSMSRAEEDTPFDHESIYELDGTSTATVRNANSDNPRISFVGGDDFRDTDLYEFDEIVLANQLAEETDYTIKGDAKRYLNNPAVNFVKIGGLFRSKTKENDAEEFVSDDNPAVFDTLTRWATDDNRDFLNDRYPAISSAQRGFFNSNRGAFAMERDIEESFVADYDTEEDVLAGYLMGSFNLADWEVIAGFRVEHTEFETQGFQFDAGPETVSRTRGDKDYTNFLPGIHVRRDIGEDAVLRASWTNTIARPNFEQSSPSQFIEIGEEVVFGNPELDPFESMNLDASIQYYSEDYGVFGFAVFYKDIENFIYEQTIPGAFRTGTPDETDLTTFRNGPEGDIFGIELSYSHQFKNLPGALSGLGVSANLTFTDSEATVLPADAGDPNRELPFIRQSDTIGNISVSWEHDRYFIRLSGTFRDDYLDEVGGEALEDRYIDGHFQMDLYSSIKLYKGLSMFLEVNNLNDEPLRAYWGQSGRLSQFEEYGVSGSIGAKWAY